MSNANLLNDFMDSLRAAVTAAWPEVVTNGIWEEQQIDTTAFTYIAGGDQDPYAVIEVPPLTETTEQDRGGWGLDNRMMEGYVYFHYIAPTPEAAVGHSPWETLRNKLDALRLRLFNVELDEGQVLEVSQPNWSKAHAANSTFIHKNMPNIAGSIEARCILGDHA